MRARRPSPTQAAPPRPASLERLGQPLRRALGRTMVRLQLRFSSHARNPKRVTAARATVTRRERPQPALAATTRGSNTNRLGSVGSIVALTQCVLRAPKVSTRVKLASTPPSGRLIGLSALK
jgi:hypothetical protein